MKPMIIVSTADWQNDIDNYTQFLTETPCTDEEKEILEQLISVAQNNIDKMATLH